jgi:hypothetical protein
MLILHTSISNRFRYTRHRVTQKLHKLKYSLVFTGGFRFKPAIQFVEQYRSIVSCALNMDDLISNNCCKFIT